VDRRGADKKKNKGSVLGTRERVAILGRVTRGNFVLREERIYGKITKRITKGIRKIGGGWISSAKGRV